MHLKEITQIKDASTWFDREIKGYNEKENQSELTDQISDILSKMSPGSDIGVLKNNEEIKIVVVIFLNREFENDPEVACYLWNIEPDLNNVLDILSTVANYG
jgi:hypothetical protein